MSDQKYRNALPIDSRISHYLIEKILGQGGFGITYLVRDEKLDRLLAVKEYFPGEFAHRETDATVHPQSDEDAEIFNKGLERFLEEGKTLARFKHPNIVRVVDYLEQNNTGYIVMEYEQGNDLQHILKQKKTLPADELLRLFLPLLDGLSQVHQLGFIHRDIKPANIFIRDDGSPVLIDFGSARQGFAGKTRTLTALVSPGFAPFEQYNAEGMNKQGPWTDIYALGASMYKSLFGKSPLDAISRAEERFSGYDDNYLSAMNIGKGHYPESLLNAIDQAMAFLPTDRPQSIESWLTILNSGAGQTVTPGDDVETVKIETQTVATEVIQPALNNKQDNTAIKSSALVLRLAITKYIVIGMLSFWSYTSYMLSHYLIKLAATYDDIDINPNMKYVFSGIYVLLFLLVLSWVVPNVFLGYVLGEQYILKIVLISAILFYLNTAVFVLWYMKQVRLFDNQNLEQDLNARKASQEEVKKARNDKISKWEAIDNHVVLFLLVSFPICLSPYVCARLFYTSTNAYLLLLLPVIVMIMGGIFHVWGTRLLVNTYNTTLVR